MTPSRQPTHHGYAVNVKDHSLYADHAPLTDEEAQAIYDDVVALFWDDAQWLAKQYGFDGVYSEGRMGGWCVLHPQPRTDGMYDEEIAAWERDKFRPFEEAILVLLEDSRIYFADELKEAIERAAAEPAERAYWEARDTVTLED